LLEQTHLGHGDDDYSVVARKYQPAPVTGEELQLEEEEEQPGVLESSVASPDDAKAPSEQPVPVEASPATAIESSPINDETTRLRPSFFKQLLSRLSSGKE